MDEPAAFSAARGPVADRLVTARKSPSMRVRIVPLLQVRRRAARLLLLFNRGFPRLIGLLCGFLVRSLARIAAGRLPGHRRASRVAWTAVTGFFTSITSVCPRPTTSTTTTATAEKMASALFILGLR